MGSAQVRDRRPAAWRQLSLQAPGKIGQPNAAARLPVRSIPLNGGADLHGAFGVDPPDHVVALARRQCREDDALGVDLRGDKRRQPFAAGLLQELVEGREHRELQRQRQNHQQQKITRQ